MVGRQYSLVIAVYLICIGWRFDVHVCRVFSHRDDPLDDTELVQL